MIDKETSMDALKNFVEKFVKERDWSQFHSPKNISMALSIEASELIKLTKPSFKLVCADGGINRWKPEAPITTPARSSPTIVGKLSLTKTSARVLAARNINRNLITPIRVSATSKSCALSSAKK